MPAAATPLHRFLLGEEPRQQLRASQALLALVVYAVFAAVQHTEVLLGLIDAGSSWPLSMWNLSGGLLFWVLIRSGMNQALTADRAMTLPQCLWAMVGIAWSYAITGPARGGVMLIMLLIVVFGIFALTPGQARAVAAVGLALLGGVMLWKALTEPERYDPRIEVIHFVFATIVMAAITQLAIRLGRLRERLVAQRGELSAALERIERLATHDELTGLINRRAALDLARRELAVRDRPAPMLSVALLDIDHFKRVNDERGHAAGDEVLRRFARRAGEGVRAADALARWGGEEFLLLLPATAIEGALQVVQRLRERIVADAFADIDGGADLRITFSAGVAECGGEADLQAAIERADAALYEAKRAGRDRVIAATGTATAAQPPT